MVNTTILHSVPRSAGILVHDHSRGLWITCCALNGVLFPPEHPKWSHHWCLCLCQHLSFMRLDYAWSSIFLMHLEEDLLQKKNEIYHLCQIVTSFLSPQNLHHQFILLWTWLVTLFQLLLFWKQKQKRKTKNKQTKKNRVEWKRRGEINSWSSLVFSNVFILL